ncbi:hypothetical protein F5Y16DRAFT_405964 [Xylariaceae sp. FL0255]|nr:hypothetical protein F5Y16DRAFT_405964 [Xylariaceae sp. FL0255]
MAERQLKKFDFAMAAQALLDNIAVDDAKFRTTFRRSIFEQLEACLDRDNPSAHDGILFYLCTQLWKKSCFGVVPWGDTYPNIGIGSKGDPRAHMDVDTLYEAIKVVKKDPSYAIHLLHTNNTSPKQRVLDRSNLSNMGAPLQPVFPQPCATLDPFTDSNPSSTSGPFFLSSSVKRSATEDLPSPRDDKLDKSNNTGQAETGIAAAAHPGGLSPTIPEVQQKQTLPSLLSSTLE